jgi:Leucine-rich repeat (LRR) protein
LQNSNSDELDLIFSRIVHRCAGSPLAAKAFGSLLSNKTSMNEWKDTLAKSNICNERTGILPILKLSFDDLPSHMKQCFAFCALFPKDYEIDVDLLIQLWMAHDFIPVQDGDQPEAVGAQIFKELTWRSFFQDVKQTFPIRHPFCGSLPLRKRTICNIHDLMHKVAQFIMGKECTTIVGKPTVIKLLPNPTRHVFLSGYDGYSVFGKRQTTTLLDHLLKKQPAMLQTLFFPRYYGPFDISQYTSLRALHLPAQSSYGQTHHTGQIQHLRYLNLSGYWLEKLPEEISLMHNLQTLDLSYCKNLRQLPHDMKYMASLRHLYTTGCESLTCMPPGLGQITCLQTNKFYCWC